MLARAARLVIGTTAAAVDRAATYAANASTARRRAQNTSERLGHAERLEVLGALRERYEPLAADWFRPARRIEPSARNVREGVVDLAWSSDYEPALAEVAERFHAQRENRIAGARLFRGAARRPVAILIHGYLGGAYALEQRVFPVEWLQRRGLDVALFTLPCHGVRSNPVRRAPAFPSSDPRVTNEGFRQAMGDLADFVAWLRAEDHPSVGLMGMSLGGYSTALAATLIDELAFAVPIIPLASLADFAEEHGRLGSDPRDRAEQHAALDAVHRVVSPLHRAPLTASERVLIVAAEQDRITPITHARRLAKHFRAPLQTWAGGHLLQYGRAESFRRIGHWFDELGVATPR